MFLLNSRMDPFIAPPRGGPLLPKLRGYFAEFLNEVSLERLGILVPSHLCRFTVRAVQQFLGGFLVGVTRQPRLSCEWLPIGRGRVTCGFACTSPPTYQPASISRRHVSTALPVGKTQHTGAGLLTRCPSPTSFDLGLGPADPGRTNLPRETLGFRRTGFPPVFSLLMSA